jgi:hypothetical protein
MPVFGRSFPIPRRYRRTPQRISITTETVSRHYAEVAADSPIAWYRASEGSGLVAADSSGNARAGAYSASGVSYGTAGLIRNSTDQAATFDGFAGEIQSSSNAALAPSGDFTAECWFQVIAGRPVIFRDNTSASGNIGLFNNTGFVAARIGGTTLNPGVTLYSALADGNRHYCAIRRAGTTGTLWLDGALNGTATVATGAPALPWHIARNGSSTTTNLIPNNSFETNLTGWTQGGSAGISGVSYTRDSTWASAGTWSAKVSATVNSGANYIDIRSGLGTSGFAAGALGSVSASCDINITAMPTGGTAFILLAYYDSGGALISTSQSANLTTTGVQTLTHTSTTPANTAFVGVIVRLQSASTTGTATFAIDNVLLSTASAFSNIVADEWAIYGTALSDNRLKAHYYSGVGDYGGASLTGLGSMSGVPLRKTFSTAALTGLGSLNAVGTRRILGAAALSGQGSMVAIGTRRIIGVAHLTGFGSMLVTIPLNVEDPTFVELVPLTAAAVLRERDQDVIFEALNSMVTLHNLGDDADVSMHSGSHHQPLSVKVGGDIAMLLGEAGDALLADGTLSQGPVQPDGRIQLIWSDGGVPIFTITLDAESWRGLLDLLGL